MELTGLLHQQIHSIPQYARTERCSSRDVLPVLRVLTNVGVNPINPKDPFFLSLRGLLVNAKFKGV